MPGKPSHGDIDFLAAGYLPLPAGAPLSYDTMLEGAKEKLGAREGRRGAGGVMYFAVRGEGSLEGEMGEVGEELDEEWWVQVDIKVVDALDAQAFAWAKFILDYASGMKILGSLVKPLGLSILPSGMYIRVADMEAVDWNGSMEFVTGSPEDVLRVLGLDRRFLAGRKAGFDTEGELYEWVRSTWVFHEGHFRERWRDERYRARVEERSQAWMGFLTRCVGGFDEEEGFEIQGWRRDMGAEVKEKVFTLFPDVAGGFYKKRGAYLAEVEEKELRTRLMDTIPEWDEDTAGPPPRIVFEADTTAPTTAITAPPTPPASRSTSPSGDPQQTSPPHPNTLERTNPPLHLPSLPQTPPLPFTPRPPPPNMSPEAKLTCLARWTGFSPLQESYLLLAPREKGFELRWSESGVQERLLVEWVRGMWGKVWVRQGAANWVGMWRRRFEKEGEKRRVEEGKRREEEMKERKKEEEMNERREKILERLRRVNSM